MDISLETRKLLEKNWEKLLGLGLAMIFFIHNTKRRVTKAKLSKGATSEL